MICDGALLHTLRRKVGIQPHMIEAVLNHVSGHRAGVAGIYNLADARTGRSALRSTDGLIICLRGSRGAILRHCAGRHDYLARLRRRYCRRDRGRLEAMAMSLGKRGNSPA